MAKGKFFYRERQIVMVDYGPNPANLTTPVEKGPLSVLPEMYKTRHAIVMAKSMLGTTTVVPLSTNEPQHVMDFHYEIEARTYDSLNENVSSWVKANMISNVSNERINRPLFEGRRTTILIELNHFKEIRKAVLSGLGMGKLNEFI